MTSSISLSHRLTALIAVVALSFAAAMPLLTSQLAHADELPNRSVTIDKAYANATDVAWAFQFDLPTAQEREGIILRFCTSALGVCTAPTGMNVGGDTVTVDGQTGWPGTAGGTSFTQYTGDLNDCQETTNSTTELCFTRTEATASVGGETVTFTISGITAPSANDTVYARIVLYEDATFNAPADPDKGVVAAAFVNQLTVSATVAEYLEFCVGTIDAATQDDCSDISGTTMNIGTVPFNAICYSGGANPCENDDGRDGYAMVATNAANGVTVSYYAEQDGTGTEKLGALRIPGATCTNTVGDYTDQCFESAGTTPVAFTAGQENFGMTVKQIDTTNGGLTTNVTRATNYNGDGIADAEGCADAGVTPDLDCWAWDETGTVQQLASSPSVVDDEMLVLAFGAAATLTTPTGTYSVTSTYIATPTF